MVAVRDDRAASVARRGDTARTSTGHHRVEAWSVRSNLVSLTLGLAGPGGISFNIQ